MTIWFFVTHKAAAITPQGPADAVPFQRGAHVHNPGRAIHGRSNFAIGPEFITGKRDVIPGGPGGGGRDLSVDAGRVPTVFAIAAQDVPPRLILKRGEKLA